MYVYTSLAEIGRTEDQHGDTENTVSAGRAVYR